MGNFVDAVRQDRVPGPLRRDFKLKNWNQSFVSLGEDDADKNLHLVGLILNAKAAAIRGQLKMTFNQQINATTKIRAFTALANRDMLIVQHQTRAVQAEMVLSKDVISIPDIANIRLSLASGQLLSPDEILQSLVDGVQISLKTVLNLNQPLGGSPKFNKVVWDDVASDFNLGNFYQQIEELWDDCLWNDYRCEEVVQVKNFSPRSAFWGRLNAASRARQQNLIAEFFGRSRIALEELIAEGRCLCLPRDVRSIERENRRQIVQLTAFGEPTEQSLALLAAKSYASEPYYTELLTEPQAKIGGASLNDLLGAWTTVVQCTAFLSAKLSAEVSREPLATDWINKLAPVLQREALRRAVHESNGVDYKRSGELIDFLTYRGLPAQELWAQPLVPVSEDTLAPVFAAALHADPLRLVDVWLRQLGVDMGVRGAAFEANIRAELRDDIESSPLLDHSKVLDKSFVLRPKEDRDEEIDILFVIGNLVVVGEAKCSVPPTDSKAYAIHRKLVEGATAQISRKAAAVEKHRELFRNRLAEVGIDIPTNFRVLPIVILNAAFHAGMAVDGVPIVDMYILSVFFSGRLVEAARGKDMKPIRERILYRSAEEAASKAADILQSPPQMELFVNGIRKVDISLLAVTTGDWEGRYQTFECVIDSSHLFSLKTEEAQLDFDTLKPALAVG